MSRTGAFRARAEGLSAALPPLLVRADLLARTVLAGAHGRRRAGAGDDFWQYRALSESDERRSIDWRRSARSDEVFVRDREAQVAQSVWLWCDTGASMQDGAGESKAARAQLLTLAAALLLSRAGERVGLLGADLPPRRGPVHELRLAEALMAESGADYAVPPLRGLPARATAVLFSDFFATPGALQAALEAAPAARLFAVQVTARGDERLPFAGRVILESPGGTLRHETGNAAGLRAGYAARLAGLRAALGAATAARGGSFLSHVTDTPPETALLALWRALDGRGV